MDDTALVLVECESCHLYWLGGLGTADDPVYDPTYEVYDGMHIWICGTCYEDKKHGRLN